MSIRADNLRPKLTFEGDKVHIKFKYPPTQDEFNLAMLHIDAAMQFANKQTGEEFHLKWRKEES